VIDKVEPLFGQVYCYLGRSMWNADPFFKGRIDDFRIYNYALPASAIAELAQKRFSLADLCGLAVWWLSVPPDCAAEPDCLAYDCTGDGRIDFSDFAELARGWL